MKTQIHTLVEPIIREKIEKSFFSGTVFEELIENLAFEMSIRTLIFELNYQKPCLKGTDDKDKYLCFLQKFEEKDYQEELKGAYPVLFSAIDQMLRNITQVSLELTERFQCDKERITWNLSSDCILRTATARFAEINGHDAASAAVSLTALNDLYQNVGDMSRMLALTCS